MVASAWVRRRRGWALVVAGAALLAAGRDATTASPSPVVTEEMMLVETEALARAVGEARKGRVVIDWERRLVDRVEARAMAGAVVRGAVAAGGGRADTEVDAQVFQRLGLLTPDARYADLISDAAARDPVGFYDPAARRLYVPSYIPLPDQRVVLAHEIAHALQDQRFGLRRFLKITADGRRGLSFDAELARQAVIEGDAAVLALEAVDPRAPFPAPPELGEVGQRARAGLAGAAADRPESPVSPVSPRFLRELLAFPTLEGFAFIARARARASWAAIDAIWARPPDSTAQILHPERYDRGVAAAALEIPPLPLMGDGWRWARAETFGELLIRVWLSSERAAAGWRGDRMAIYLSAVVAPPAGGGVGGAGGGDAGVPEAGAAGAGAALAWLTVWDGDADADDFLQAVVPRLAALAAGGAAPEPSGPADTSGQPAVWRARADDTIYAAARRGALVALLLGAPPAALPSLATMLDGPRPGGGPRRGLRAAPDAKAGDRPRATR
ncbi:MAG TPA: hypothetical protein VFH68_05225 [Polyangia bacterium]|nr:hypothetical protein [Polyangia bacterium]